MLFLLVALNVSTYLIPCNLARQQDYCGCQYEFTCEINIECNTGVIIVLNLGRSNLFTYFSLIR